MLFGLYVDLVPFYEKVECLNEDISDTEKIKSGNNYPIEDHIRIRRQIKNKIVPIANEIRKEPYIKYANPDISSPRIQRGLSVYIDFAIDYPDDVTQDEINRYYKYSIRFSEHEDLHGTDKNRYYVELEGRTLNDLYRVGLRKFNSKKEKIQKRIRDFELEKFGEQRTYITDERPDETVSEKLKIAEAPLQFRRSVGNWNPRTIGYDFDDIVFSIKDAKKAAIFCRYFRRYHVVHQFLSRRL